MFAGERVARLFGSELFSCLLRATLTEAELAFTDERQVTDAKMAILLASVLSGVVSFAVLRGARANHA